MLASSFSGVLRRPRPISQCFSWIVIRDPSGDFQGRRFQKSDLSASAALRTWPNGITFRHTRSGKELTYHDGVLREKGMPVYKLLLNGKMIYQSTRRRVHRSVLLRYVGSADVVNDVMKALNVPGSGPVVIEDKRLEWISAEVQDGSAVSE